MNVWVVEVFDTKWIAYDLCCSRGEARRSAARRMGLKSRIVKYVRAE